MATAQEIINDAAMMAGVLADGQTIGPSMNASILRALNRILQQWEYLAVPELDYEDTLRLPASDIRAIVLNLVVDLFMIYQRPQRPDIVMAAQSALNDMLIRYANISELNVPIELVSKTPVSILNDE